MGELLQLDAAAALVGKSEVTLRRLVKAGKVKAHKEKTLTGFIYRVDSGEVLAYYNQKEVAFAGALGTSEPEKTEKPHHPAAGRAIASNGKIRVAIANESGNSAEYWLKRAEIYEDKYHREVQRSAEMREELGTWRGRAEHAQAMLMKMLPAPTKVEIMAQGQRNPDQPKGSGSLLIGILLFAIFVVVVGMAVYILYVK